MEQPWYRKMFSRPQPTEPEMTPAPLDYGDAEVQFGMGLKFARGAGVPADYRQAAEWYRKAAEQRHSLAQFNLGIMYASGQGVKRDHTESAMWFGKAAHQGDAGAQSSLAKSCHRASLTDLPPAARESRIEAYKWYQLAAAQGYGPSDSACSTLIQSMTREDVAVADQRVADFEPGKNA
jgi:uncharacterized protein